MKFCAALLLASVGTAAAQLFGLGASCPVIELDIISMSYGPPTGTLMAVVHGPEFELVDQGQGNPEATDELVDVMNDHSQAYNSLTAANFGVDDSMYVCGDAGEGYVVALSEENDNPIFPGESYDRFSLSPSNKGSCNCGNMRISILASWAGVGVAYLNSHELESLSEPSGARFGIITISNTGLITDYINPPNLQQLHVKFTPIAGSSASFLSLWALLMQGWW